jgi:predicted acetyltransferase
MALEIGRLRPGDVEAARRLAHQAFQPATRSLELERPWHAAARVHAVYAEDRLVACAAVHEAAQWVGGARVPMAGVASVSVAPDMRGQGLARAMLRDALRAMRERGECISMLYPTTNRLYHGLGWAIAGNYRVTRFPLRLLEGLPRPATLQALRPAEYDWERFAPLAAALTRASGGLERSEVGWRQQAHALRSGYTYVVERGGALAGYLSYVHLASRGAAYGLDLRDLRGVDVDVVFALLNLLASHGSIADHVLTTLPVEWLALHLPQQGFEPVQERLWMLRIVDAPAALASRGYLPGVSARVELALRDALLPENEGAWLLEVRDGKAELGRGGAGRVQLDVTALAALYTGWSSPWDLARSGQLRGARSEDLKALAAAFAGPRPQLVDYF